LLSIVATGLYDTIKAPMEGNYVEETIVVIATVVVVLVIFVAFHGSLSKED
jgi:hypothetical protein